MTNAAVVRRASAGDRADFRTVIEGFDPGMIDLPEQLFHDRYARLVDRDDYCLLLAYREAEPVGYALAQDYGPNLRLRFTIGRLHDLYVAEEHRRHGLGRLLMDGVFAWARGRPEPMILHWQASQEAVAFYESLGLEADRVGDYPRYPGFSLDLRTAG
ncbi:GNAT family N-acetyltransferase [Microlunatus sp. GCM10028923]|uniref:GNAT family N-acetyltransferase n=1 Tax=Microlunatus sp. GCM10028923 TaxID=3273400 RepID=UPI00361A48B8